MKKYLAKVYESARLLNDGFVIKSLADIGQVETMLDVGCWDGKLTTEYAKACKAKKVYGIEIVKEMSDIASTKGIECHSLIADKEKWPFENNSLDCVVSNQVIEHLTDVDFFLKEASRVLKPNGYLVTSTNNLSSWHNIFALIFGWAPFDLTNSSNITLGLGNPLAVHRSEKSELSSWTHKCIYTPRWLFEWQFLYGLKRFRQYGAGFYPLPSALGNIFKTHAAFQIITTKKV